MSSRHGAPAVWKDTDVFRYRIAEPGSDDLESWHRLRTGQYLDHGLIAGDDIDPDSGLFVDPYDDHSTHVLAANDDGLDIGCIRMVEQGDGRTLPVTDLFGIDVLPHAWESSANAVLPEYRRTPVKLGFFRALFALAEEKGYENMYAIVELPYLDTVRRSLGLPIEVVSEERFVFNAPNVATLITRNAVVAAMAVTPAEASGFAAYLRKPFDWTLSSADLTPVG
jgi:N-acyl-L-homoserine lactone synthetase